MEEVGLYLMYDMRWTYMNNTAVTEEVNRIKNSPALLLWYTGDEPDGTSDPLNATTIAYDLIYSLDGYHPVSLVLNCENFFWSEYTAGADIVMQDTYMVGINATFSTVWVRVCARVFAMISADCGFRTRPAPQTTATAAATTATASLKISAPAWMSSPSGALLMAGSCRRPRGPFRRALVPTREWIEERAWS